VCNESDWQGEQLADTHPARRIKSLWSCSGDISRMDQGELQRYLGEMVWFPTAWLSDAITWQAIDAHSVRATLREQNVTGSVMLHINELGQITHITADRYGGAQGEFTPWLVRTEDYREVCGMHIPTTIEVTWHLAPGDFTWFRCRISQIEYNQSGKLIVL
jgi:Family of unknown function (DUF6920)